MWARLGKISRGGDCAPPPAATETPATPSFKDVHALLLEDDDAGRRRRVAVFHRLRLATSAIRTWRFLPQPPSAAGDKQIVVYYTSLRVVRRTFEDCRTVRSILRGFRVAIDERDLAMDSAFLAELKSVLGRRQLSLPRVFIGGRYVGGADEIRQLNESGELKSFVEGAPPAAAGACAACCGERFLLCSACSGSHKHYSEKRGFRNCASCNENGLVRCPDCCSSAV